MKTSERNKIASGIEAMLLQGFDWKPGRERTTRKEAPETVWVALVTALGLDLAHQAYWLATDVVQNKSSITINRWEDDAKRTKKDIETLLRRVLVRLG